MTQNRPTIRDFPVDTIERIRDISKYDLQLYDLANLKHSLLIESLNTDIEEKVRLFKKENEQYNRKKELYEYLFTKWPSRVKKMF